MTWLVSVLPVFTSSNRPARTTTVCGEAACARQTLTERTQKQKSKKKYKDTKRLSFIPFPSPRIWIRSTLHALTAGGNPPRSTTALCRDLFSCGVGRIGHQRLRKGNARLHRITPAPMPNLENLRKPGRPFAT